MRKRSLLVATFSAAWAFSSLTPLYAQSMGGGSSSGGGMGGGGGGLATGTTGAQYGFGSIMESGGPSITRTTGFGQATIFGTRDLGMSSSGANRSFSGQSGSLGVYGGGGGGGGGGLGGRGVLGGGVGGLNAGGGMLGGNFAGGMGGSMRGGMGGLGGGLGGMGGGLGGMGMGMGGMGMGGMGMGGMGGMGRSGMGGGMMGGQMGGQMGRNQMGMGQNRNSTVRPIRPRLNIGFSPTPITATQVTTALSTRFNELGSQREGIRIESRGPVQVTLEGQTAILRGVVATEHDREVAGSVALLEPGVSLVRNELRVAAPVSAD